MGSTIKTNSLAACMAADALRAELDAFCALRLTSLSWALPGSGSQDHDGRIQGTLHRALDAYRAMVEGDAGLARALSDAYVQADAQVAHALGGS